MTTHAAPTRSVRRAARATTRATVLASVVALSVLAAPAHADVPEGWTDPVSIDPLEALLILLGVPLLLFVLILVAVYLPAMKRGEPLLPDHSPGEGQWIGGPRQGTKELPAPDGADSRAGGASGSW